jgi:hypothetical protein
LGAKNHWLTPFFRILQLILQNLWSNAIAKLRNLDYKWCIGKNSRPHSLPRGENSMEFEGYCVKCRGKVTIKNGTVKETSNGRKMAQGACPKCGTKVTRFLSTK